MDVPVADRTKSAGKRRSRAQKAPPCTLVIFGAGGDLTKRLLMPAIYNLVEGETTLGQIRDHRGRPHAKADRGLSRLFGRWHQELCLGHRFRAHDRAIHHRHGNSSRAG